MKLFLKVENTINQVGSNNPRASASIQFDGRCGLGHETCDQAVSYISMISLGAFVIILFGLLAAVVWACAEDTNET
jgi:hypothetical protein